jgi:hypothetical protein
MELIMGEQTLRGKISAYKCNGASNHSNVDREINDFYATPDIATKPLIEYLKVNYPDMHSDYIWEPACGKGHISKSLIDNGFNVLSTDIIDRGYRPGNYGNDYNFLNNKNKHTDMHIITNPPYKYAQEFVEKSIEIMEDGKLCCMLLKLTFLEGNKRYDMFQKYPPKHLLVFSNRINCALGGDFESTSKFGGAVAYGWYIWEKGYTGKTMIEWIKA